jgi:hypothetical protein
MMMWVETGFGDTPLLISKSQGSLDILVQRTGAQSGQKVTFIQNNFYHDAFFLKAQGELMADRSYAALAAAT